MHLEDWPAADRTLWTRLLQTGGPFNDRGALAHLRASSIETLQARYGRWLGWLARTDAAALDEPPAQRATLPRLRAWLAALDHTAPMSRLMFVDGVLRVLRAAQPEAGWSAQRRLLAHLKRAAGRGDPARKQGRILSSRVLLQAGLRLASQDTDVGGNALSRAEAQRNGTMVALLAAMPIRCRPFAELTLGTSLIEQDRRLMIVLDEDLSKTGRPWEAAVPDVVGDVLHRYIAQTRPFLMARRGQRHDRLWVDRKGRPYTPHGLSVRVAETTQKLTGHRIPPHLFRDAAATTLARESPRDAGLIRGVLGHASFETAERHYIQARTIEAGRDYAAVLQRLRKR
jgi:integrase/recombinase XerD